MYRELTPADHLNVIGIEGEALPDVALIVGAMAVQETGERFSAYLRKPGPLAPLPLLRRRMARDARRAGRLLRRANGCRARAYLVWRRRAHGGAARLVRRSQHGTAFGDVIVPRHAERQDGTSDWYLPKGILADSTPALSDAITRSLTGRDITVHEQAIYSTPALLAESREVIADWSRHG